MIRFRIKKEALIALIDAESPNWRRRATSRRKAAIAARSVGTGEGIWSEIKGVYMRLQGYKCMYCEKPLPKSDDSSLDETASGKVEYDVEHFRPKNRVSAWPPPRLKKRRRITYEHQLQHGVPGGYVWLAFDPMNYGVSCKTCNSELKGDHFPILGSPGTPGSPANVLDASEIPCLILPIGAGGVEPGDYLEWTGPLVRPRVGLSTLDTLRARVIIDFFELDTRRDLLEARCRAILLLMPKLPSRSTSPKARRFVAALTEDDASFAGCLRDFVTLYDKNPGEAKDWERRCEAFVETKGSSRLQ